MVLVVSKGYAVATVRELQFCERFLLYGAMHLGLQHPLSNRTSFPIVVLIKDPMRLRKLSVSYATYSNWYKSV